MTRTAILLLSAALAGCSNLAETDGGVTTLEIAIPFPATVAVGSTITLEARALNRDGDPVTATIVWQTPEADEAFLTVDATTGIVTGVAAGSGRVQAVTGTLASELVTLTVVEPVVP